MHACFPSRNSLWNAMKEHRSSRIRSAQHGYTVIFLVAFIGVLTAAWLATSLGSTAVHIERERKTSAALALAKQALVGRATADSSLPGSLPCPDLKTQIAGTNVPDDGIADLFAGTNCPSYIGRLPWRTLGLPDLRDADGERLWYALSSNFRDFASVVTINDSTPGTLSVAGNAPAANIAAIVFAAGAPLAGQSRGGSADRNNVVNFLDGANAAGGSAFVSQSANSAFNDRLIVVTVADLMAVVEKRVAFEITTALNKYFLANSVLPAAASAHDATCQRTGDRNLCLPAGSTASGILPRNLGPGTGWPGVTFPAWFDANWRTSVGYAVAPECTVLPACSNTTFSPLTDAGLFPPKVTLVVGTTIKLTVREVAK
jgi:hypothetical protein